MSQFTHKDAIELGQPLPLLRKWETVMNILWSFFSAYAKQAENVQIKNEENTIKYQTGVGHKFEIGINLINSEYLQLYIKIEGNEEFEATINNIEAFGKEGIIRTVGDILTFSENVAKIST